MTPSITRAREIEAELASLYPPYSYSYITERNPVTLAQMRADGERRRQELQEREEKTRFKAQQKSRERWQKYRAKMGKKRKKEAKELKWWWWLYLDDERYPPGYAEPHFPRVAREWRIARNVSDARWLIETYGIPTYMSLDHDLGANNLSGMDFVKWFCGYLMDTGAELPGGFHVRVHSQNPVGKENMLHYLANFMKQEREDEIVLDDQIFNHALRRSVKVVK